MRQEPPPTALHDAQATLEADVLRGDFTPFLGAGASSLRPLESDLTAEPWRSIWASVLAIKDGLEQSSQLSYLQSFAKQRLRMREALERELDASPEHAARKEEAARKEMRADRDDPLLKFQRALVRLATEIERLFGGAFPDSLAAPGQIRDVTVRLAPDGHHTPDLISELLLAVDLSLMLLQNPFPVPAALRGRSNLREFLSSRIYEKLLTLAVSLINRDLWESKVMHGWRKRHRATILQLGGLLAPPGTSEVYVTAAMGKWLSELLWYTLRWWAPLLPTTNEMAFELELRAAFAPFRVADLAQAAQALKLPSTDLTDAIKPWLAYCHENMNHLTPFQVAMAAVLQHSYDLYARDLLRRSSRLSAAEVPTSRPLPIAFTTNFDRCLEEVFREMGVTHHVAFPVRRRKSRQIKWKVVTWHQGGFRERDDSGDDHFDVLGPIVVHLHGSPLEAVGGDYEHWLVLTEIDYLEAVSKRRALPPWLDRELLAGPTSSMDESGRSFWYLGHSINDWNVRLQIFERADSWYHSRNSLVDGEMDSDRMAKLTSLGVRVYLGDLVNLLPLMLWRALNQVAQSERSPELERLAQCLEKACEGATAEPISSPWPGPRPYDESEWPIFFGREREVAAVMSKMRTSRLTLLTGPSGSGKTSLLRAGIVPHLRLQRYREGSKVWPVLVVRDWSVDVAAGLTTMLKMQVERSLDALSHWYDLGARAAEDRAAIATALGRVSATAPPLDIAEQIVSEEGIGGLYLVFDQLEEMLRFSKTMAKEALTFIENICDSELPIKVLIALREEHLVDLRGLERSVGGLLSNTVYLSPMDTATAREALVAAARERGVVLGDYVIGELMKLMGIKEGERFNLVGLQALLHDFFSEVRAQGYAISRTLIEAYRDRLAEQLLMNDTPADYAMKRWIERAVTTPQDSASDLPQEGVNALVRRVAIRLASNLSSGGFKVSQEDSDLMRKGIGEDLSVLLANPEQLRLVKVISRDPPRLNTADLTLGGTAGMENVSGLAYARQWTGGEAANMLFAAYQETLTRLTRGNVIRPVLGGGLGQQDSRRWELVHDSLGGPFSEWAIKRIDDWQDCCASLVACRGIVPILIRPADSEVTCGQRVHHLRWEGCLIMPSSDQLTFRNVLFEACSLRGTIFKGVTFVGCRFVECELSGTIFMACRFLAGDQECSFESCAPEGLVLNAAAVSGLRFVRCNLTQLTLRNVEFREAPVVFSSSHVSLSNFVGLTSKLVGPAVHFEADCSLRFCTGDDASWDLLDFGQSTVERSKEKRNSE